MWQGEPAPDGHGTQPTGPRGMLHALALLPTAGVPAGGCSRAEQGWVLALVGAARRLWNNQHVSWLRQGCRRPGRGSCSFPLLPAGPGTWASLEQRRAASVDTEEIVLILVLVFTVSFDDRGKVIAAKYLPLYDNC